MRLVLVFSCAFALVACASAAQPAPPPSHMAGAIPSPHDADIIAECIAEKGLDQAHACVGVITRACSAAMGEDAASTNAGMMQCFMREAADWRDLRDDAMDQLRASEPEHAALMDNANTAGDAWAETRCAYAASIYEGGSLARVVRAECERNAAADLAIPLLQRLDLLDQ